MRTGFAHLPLHSGKAPTWLVSRMARLAREIICHIVSEYGPDEVLRRLADPYWFQAFGCVLGFDWHSSGVTTTTTGAIKEGIKGLEKDLGFWATGGKGKTSRRTPHEIEAACEHLGREPGGPRLCEPHVSKGGQRGGAGRLSAFIIMASFLRAAGYGASFNRA
jgi:uncharacterized protein